MPPPVTINVTITETLTCPDCGGIRLQPQASSRRQCLCLACGLMFHAEQVHTADVFNELLAQQNAAPEVAFASVRDEVFAVRGW